MKRMRYLREAAGLSKLEVSRRARVAPSVIGWSEGGRFRPYPVQMRRIAAALGWVGDPMDLLEEADDDA